MTTFTCRCAMAKRSRYWAWSHCEGTECLAYLSIARFSPLTCRQMMCCSWPLPLLPLLLITVLSQPVSSINEADAIRLLDPCAAELGIAAATSDNLACFVELVDQAPSSRCFNRSNICDGEIFCSNGTDEGMGFTSSQSRIVCGMTVCN